MEERESGREEAYRAKKGGQERLNREGMGKREEEEESRLIAIPYLFILSILSMIL
jgi:hypothetical protein